MHTISAYVDGVYRSLVEQMVVGLDVGVGWIQGMCLDRQGRRDGFRMGTAFLDQPAGCQFKYKTYIDNSSSLTVRHPVQPWPFSALQTIGRTYPSIR